MIELNCDTLSYRILSYSSSSPIQRNSTYFDRRNFRELFKNVLGFGLSNFFRSKINNILIWFFFQGEDKNKSPSSPNPSTPSFPATAAATPPQMNQQQQQFLQQQMQQFYNNTNNPLLNNQQQPFSSQMPSSVTTTTTDQQQPAATTPTTTTESNETTLRQRTTRSQQPRNDEDNNNRYFENTTNRTSEQSSNVETSRAETISFYLVWIILIPLIILILRRLGMEGGGMSKHEGWNGAQLAFFLLHYKPCFIYLML